MIVPEEYLLMGGVAAVAALALLIYWVLRRRRAAPRPTRGATTPGTTVILPANAQKGGVNPFNTMEYMTSKGMVKKTEEPTIHIPETVTTDGFTNWLEDAIRNAANSSSLHLKVKIPDGATVDLFGKKGWLLSGEIEIGGDAKQEEEEKPQESGTGTVT